MNKEICHCGQPLHYSDRSIEEMVRNSIERLGEYLIVNYDGKAYKVPRHYIVLHGVKSGELHALGFEEV